MAEIVMMSCDCDIMLTNDITMVYNISCGSQLVHATAVLELTAILKSTIAAKMSPEMTGNMDSAINNRSPLDSGSMYTCNIHHTITYTPCN